MYISRPVLYVACSLAGFKNKISNAIKARNIPTRPFPRTSESGKPMSRVSAKANVNIKNIWKSK